MYGMTDGTYIIMKIAVHFNNGGSLRLAPIIDV